MVKSSRATVDDSRRVSPGWTNVQSQNSVVLVDPVNCHALARQCYMARRVYLSIGADAEAIDFRSGAAAIKQIDVVLGHINHWFSKSQNQFGINHLGFAVELDSQYRGAMLQCLETLR